MIVFRSVILSYKSQQTGELREPYRPARNQITMATFTEQISTVSPTAISWTRRFSAGPESGATTELTI